MATITWIGGSSTSANTDANWQGGTKPAAGDVALFDNNATANCVWDIATPGGNTLSVDELIVESTFATGGSNRTITLNTKIRVKGLFANGTIVAGSTTEIIFYGGFGAYKTYNSRYVLIGDNAVITGLLFTMSGTGVKFDDGQHPTVVLADGTYGPDYETPTGTSGKASFTAFTIGDTVTSFAPLAAVDANDRKKIFDFTAFTCSITGFDAGESTFEFLAGSGSGFALPVKTATFTPVYRKVVLKAGTAGHKITVADNSILTCDELEIQDGCMMIGPQGTDQQGSEIRTTLPPKIRGSWSYSQLSNGLYRSPKYAVGPVPKVENLTVDGLIIDEAANIGATGHTTAATKGLLWVKNDAPNSLYFTNDAGNDIALTSGSAIAGGGGSGDITGVTITTDSGGGSKAEDTGGSADFSLLGANGVGVTNSGTTITAVAVPGEIDHDSLNNFVAAEHVDWAGASAGTIHASNHADTNTQLSNAEVRAAVEAATDSNVFTDDDHTKLNALDLLEFAEYRMVNHNPSTSSSNDFNSNTRWVADLADTSFWTAATTASDHTSIVLDSDGYLTLAANGIYDVWFSTDIFGHGTSAANIDSFIEISTNNSGDRRYATTRKVIRINGINVKYNHQTTAKIRTGGSAVDIYFSAYLNGCGYYLAAYNDYRTSVKVIRLGDA